MLHCRFLVVINKWVKVTYLDSNAMSDEEMILSLLCSSRSQSSTILADGHLHAYSANKGEDLWSFDARVAVTGVPITYSVNGRQYVTITSGPLNGTAGAFGSLSAQWGWDPRIHPKRLLTFTIDGSAKIPPTAPPRMAVPISAPEFTGYPVAASSLYAGDPW